MVEPTSHIDFAAGAGMAPTDAAIEELTAQVAKMNGSLSEVLVQVSELAASVVALQKNFDEQRANISKTEAELENIWNWNSSLSGTDEMLTAMGKSRRNELEGLLKDILALKGWPGFIFVLGEVSGDAAKLHHVPKPASTLEMPRIVALACNFEATGIGGQFGPVAFPRGAMAARVAPHGTLATSPQDTEVASLRRAKLIARGGAPCHRESSAPTFLRLVPDGLMECLRSGHKREMLLTELDKEVEEVGGEQWERALGAATPDETWDLLGGLGADTIADHSKGYMKYLDQFLAQCRSCQVTPLDWAAQGGVSTITTNYDGTNAFAATNRALLRAVAFRQAHEHDQRFAMAAIDHSTLTLEAADGTVEAESTTGAQMGFTLCPRQFNDAYNLYVTKWWEQGRADPDQIIHDTTNPVAGNTHDLALNTFMDDITYVQTILPAATAAGQGITGEVVRRIAAIRVAWRQCGIFWTSKVELRDQLRSLQRLTLQNSNEIRNFLHLTGEFWLTPLEPEWVQAPMETGREHGRKVKQLGKGHGLGPPHGQVAASLVEEIVAVLDSEEQKLDASLLHVRQLLKEFMSQLDEPWGPIFITEVFLQCKIQEAYNKTGEDVEMDIKQCKAKLIYTISTAPSFRAALYDQKLEQEQYDKIAGFKGDIFKQALGHALAHLGATKSRSGGPKTGLERAVEAQLNRANMRDPSPLIADCCAAPCEEARRPRVPNLSNPQIAESWARRPKRPGAPLAPFLAAPRRHLAAALAHFRLGPGDLFLDLGSGDGRWVHAAVERWNCSAVGLELNATLVEAAAAEAARLGLQKARFVAGDVFETLPGLGPQLGRLRLAAIFLSTSGMERIAPLLERALPRRRLPLLVPWFEFPEHQRFQFRRMLDEEYELREYAYVPDEELSLQLQSGQSIDHGQAEDARTASYDPNRLSVGVRSSGISEIPCDLSESVPSVSYSFDHLEIPSGRPVLERRSESVPTVSYSFDHLEIPSGRPVLEGTDDSGLSISFSDPPLGRRQLERLDDSDFSRDANSFTQSEAPLGHGRPRESADDSDFSRGVRSFTQSLTSWLPWERPDDRDAPRDAASLSGGRSLAPVCKRSSAQKVLVAAMSWGRIISHESVMARAAEQNEEQVRRRRARRGRLVELNLRGFDGSQSCPLLWRGGKVPQDGASTLTSLVAEACTLLAGCLMAACGLRRPRLRAHYGMLLALGLYGVAFPLLPSEPSCDDQWRYLQCSMGKDWWRADRQGCGPQGLTSSVMCMVIVCMSPHIVPELKPMLLFLALFVAGYLAASATYLYATELGYYHWGDILVVVGLLGAATVIAAYRKYKVDVQQQYADLLYQEKSDATKKLLDLLQDFLPDHIISRMLRHPSATTAEQIPKASVLFLVITDFEGHMSRRTPDQLLDFLNTLFGKIDRICFDCQVTKIETVGEEYVAAVGVKPEDYANGVDKHEEVLNRLIVAALGIFEVQKGGLDEPLTNVKFRMGLHTGPVVAGVIGQKLPRFRLFGDTMNTAARMMQKGVDGELQFGEETRACMPSWVRCRSRGKIEMKGKGQVDAYLLDWSSQDIEGIVWEEIRSYGLRKSRRSSLDSIISVSNDGSDDQDTVIGYPSTYTLTSSDSRLTRVLSSSVRGGLLRGDEGDIDWLREFYHFRFARHLGRRSDRLAVVVLALTAAEALAAELLQRDMGDVLGVRRVWMFLALRAVLLALIFRWRVVAQNKDWIFLDPTAAERWGLAYACALLILQFTAYSLLAVPLVHEISMDLSASQARAKLQSEPLRAPLWKLMYLLWYAVSVMDIQLRQKPTVYFVAFSLLAPLFLSAVLPALRNLTSAVQLTSMLIMGLVGIQIAGADEHHDRERYNAQMQVRSAQHRMDSILSQLVPPLVANELNKRQACQSVNILHQGLSCSHSYRRATIACSDLVGFTALASTRTATEVVEMVSDLFGRFDRLSDVYRICKIETVGDAYIAGQAVRPLTSVYKPISVVVFAVEMIEAVRSWSRERDIPLDCRVGVHTGECVGGVVGVEMKRYHLFGHLLSALELLESTAPTGQVHLSGACQRAVEAQASAEGLCDDALVCAPRKELVLTTSKGDPVSYQDIGGAPTFVVQHCSPELYDPEAESDKVNVSASTSVRTHARSGSASVPLGTRVVSGDRLPPAVEQPDSERPDHA
ncbi:unnamed protein product [Prorocentrum cordatum]|uniref:Guanylate cyclase domain-containing protein n=1 Tax=Prorocentrum cordatum TaxID=2364126 RepID=A0ABN9WXF2_9DINO|nr:unnamed protein product [Polarella glacialis]